MMLQYFRKIILLLIVLVPASAHAAPLSEALIYHTYFSGPEEVKRLLDKGANPNATDTHGWPALSIAADRNDENATKIAALLINAGANVNAAKDRNYPIINAIRNNNAALVALLMQRGVNIRVHDANGNSTLALAKEMENESIVYFLQKQAFEERQLQTYMGSRLRLHQLVEKFSWDNCQFQYWSFYLKSEQDKKADKPALIKRIKESATRMSEVAASGARYFRTFREGKHNDLASEIRGTIFKQLDGMISNRNRRAQGIGTETDMQKRCQAIIDDTLRRINLQ